MSVAPVLPPEIVALPADPVTGAVVIPFRHRAPEPATEPELAPEPTPRPDASPPDPAPTATPTPLRPAAARQATGCQTAASTPLRSAGRATVRQGTARRTPAPIPMPRGAVRPGTRVVRPAGRPTPTALRLTRRGKVVVAVAGVFAALAFGMLSARLVQSQTAIPDSAPATVQVQPGDTLWSIAQRVAPQADTRSVVDTIIARNNLVDGVVHPGQHLTINP